MIAGRSSARKKTLIDELSFDEERRRRVRLREQIEQFGRVFGGAVIDRQPYFACARFEARDHRTEPLHVRPQRWIEQQGMRCSDNADRHRDGVRPDDDCCERGEPAETDDQIPHSALTIRAAEFVTNSINENHAT